MARSVKPGITFYRMDSGHILNKKVRLLMNEFDSDGYYIWCCLIDYAYAKYGYYFDYNDKEDLEWFATDYCKKKITLVKEVIAGCIRRALFDEDVANSFGILTSEMMQETFIVATKDRREKGSVFEIAEDHLLLKFDKTPPNLFIVPPKNTINQPKNPQIREDKNKRRKEKNLENTSSGSPGGKPGGRKKNEDAFPHWEKLVECWFTFFKKITGENPSFAGADPRHLRNILQKLKKRAEEKNVEWSEANSVTRFNGFLQKMSEDAWMRNNFLLSNLDQKFDKYITQKNSNGNVKGTSKILSGANYTTSV